MVFNVLPTSAQIEQQDVLQKPENTDICVDSERTNETIAFDGTDSFRSFSSPRRHSLHLETSASMMDSSFHRFGADDDLVERQMRRRTISCVQDLDDSFQGSIAPRLSLPANRRITTKRASDIYLREQRESETMTSKFSLSMQIADMLDCFQSDDFVHAPLESVSKRKSLDVRESKGVSFGEIEIREYGIIPGDNPGGLAGAPLTMEWDSFSCVTIELARYEDIRQQHRREPSELVIPASYRSTLLIGLSFSREEIRSASKKASIGRKQRHSTLAKLRHHQMHYKLERAKRRALKVVTLGFKSHTKRSYLKKHCPEHYQ